MSVSRAIIGRNLSPMPGVQMKLVVFSVMVGAVAIVPLVFFDTWILRELTRITGVMDPASGLLLQDSIGLIQKRLLFAYGFSVAAFSLMSYLGGLFLTQKIVGPIYKLILFLKNQIEGDHQMKFSLREGDEFRDNLEPLFNEWVEIIKATHPKNEN